MHGTGVMSSMQTHFVGGTIVTLEGRHFDADELWRTVERKRVSQMAIVGDAFAKPMLRALDEARDAGRPYDLSSLLLVISSGDRAPTEARSRSTTRSSATTRSARARASAANDIAPPGMRSRPRVQDQEGRVYRGRPCGRARLR
jgi:fatty-acyl-CoA synthase